MTSRNLTLDQCGLFRYPSKTTERIIREFTSTAPPRIDTFMLAAKTITDIGATNLVETGCFRGSQVDGCSTMVLAAIAREVGGHLDSYELQPQNIKVCGQLLKRHGLDRYVTFHQGDSVANLAKREQKIGFAYLDSFDCGLLNQRPSQEHQLAELEAVLLLLEKQAAILLDDYLEVRGGKPKLSMRRLYARGFKCLKQDYQLLFVNHDTTAIQPAKFAVICCHDEKFVPLAVRTIYKNKAIYCIEHDYDLRIERWVRPHYIDPQSHAKGFSWSRMEAMLDLVQSGKFEWVWCVGTDTMITNMQVSLESIVAEIPADKHVAICGERVAPLQADSFLVRCSPEGIGWLKDILGQYETYKHHVWVENQTMIDCREKHVAITHILPQHKFNAYQYDLYYQYGEKYRDHIDCYGHRGNWQAGDFIVHWPATTLEKRLQLIPKYEPQIIPPHMKIVIAYTRVLGKACDLANPPEYYIAPTERFLKSWEQFKPTVPHEFVVVNCNPGKTDSMFDHVANRYIEYYGGGWDCGTYQFIANCVHADLVVCFNAFSFLWQHGWLEPIIYAAQQNGAGVYGPTASYESNPHIRTPCIAFTPALMREYPHLANNRFTAVQFESGPDNFSLWAHKNGYPTLLVTKEGSYALDDWRKPANIFRRGDQSNVLVWDRHTEIYRNASPEEKRKLENDADTRR